MNYSEFELDIVGRLSALQAAGVNVVPLPETESAYDAPYNRPRVTVAYTESSFDPVISTAQVTQEEKVRCAVIVESRKLRGSLGVHAVAQEIQRLLVGFRPQNCSRLYPVGNKFHQKDKDVWSYSMTFECRNRVVEDYTEPTAPLLQTVMFNVWAGQIPGVIGLPNGTALVLPTNQMFIPN